MLRIFNFIIEKKEAILLLSLFLSYQYFKNINKSVVITLVLYSIIEMTKPYLIVESFGIFPSVKDRNFFCKAIDKVTTKCQGHVSKKDCSKGKKCNDCEKFTYHLKQTKTLLNKILAKQFPKKKK